MISLLVEGLASALLPCSLPLLVPGFGIAVASRERSTWALLGFALGVVVSAYLRFSGTLGQAPSPVLTVVLAFATFLLLAPLIHRLEFMAGLAGALGGAAAAMLWVPCVGEEFGTLLMDLPDHSPVDMVGFVLYVAGVLTPLLFVGAVLSLAPVLVKGPMDLPARIVGGGILSIMVIAIAIGIDNEVIGQLVRWST